MILQELVRNIVTYKEVIKPYIDIWKEAIELRYGSFHTHVTSVPRDEAIRASIITAVSIGKVTGTRTISTSESLAWEHKLGKEIKEEVTSAMIGNNVVTMLMGNGVYDDVAMTSRSISFTNEICLSKVKRNNVTRNGVTTGFIFEKHKLFLSSETHEGRELLGGFSLSHERHSLLYLSERR